MNPGQIFELLRDTWKEFGEDKAARLGAALAYYTIFSIGPLILITIAVAGFFFGEQAAQGQIVGSIEGVVGTAGAEVIQEALKNAGNTGAGIVSTIIGGVTLLLGASGIFGQLQDALNTIWEVKSKSTGIVAMIKERLFTFLMVLGTGLILLAALIVNAALALISPLIQDAIPGGSFVLQILNYVVTFVLITLVFMIVYKVLPDAEISWKDVRIGAAVTAFLFMLGQFALAFYLSVSNPGSAYGAAGSLVIVLVWIFYTAQIVFLGAEFTQVYANRFGSDIQPAENAEWMTEEDRRQQGLTGTKPTRKKAQADKASAARPPLRFFGPSRREEPEPEPARAAGSAPEAAAGGPELARQSALVVGAALAQAAVLWLAGRLALRRSR
jgi:membrane protein